jgi:hypothetical protein
MNFRGNWHNYRKPEHFKISLSNHLYKEKEMEMELKKRHSEVFSLVIFKYSVHVFPVYMFESQLHASWEILGILSHMCTYIIHILGRGGSRLTHCIR